MNLKKIFLTGCSGLVGRHIYLRLVKENWNIVCVSKKKPNFIKKKHWKYLDLKKNHSNNYYSKSFGNVTHIIHAAALLPKYQTNIPTKDYLLVNYKATKFLANWALKKNIPIIYLSGAIILKENLINFKGSVDNIKYLKSKLLAEKFLLKKKRLKGLKVTIIRPTSIYGWGINKDKIIMKILNYRKKIIKIDFKYNYLYDFIHAYDIARLIVYIIKKKIMIGIIPIGGTKMSITKLFKRIFNFQNKKIEIVQENNFKKLKIINIYKWNSKILKKINFYKIISFEKGLELLSKKRIF